MTTLETGCGPIALAMYVTGAALFPTVGSWDSTLAVCGLAQDLADRLA